MISDRRRDIGHFVFHYSTTYSAGKQGLPYDSLVSLDFCKVIA